MEMLVNLIEKVMAASILLNLETTRVKTKQVDI